MLENATSSDRCERSKTRALRRIDPFEVLRLQGLHGEILPEEPILARGEDLSGEGVPDWAALELAAFWLARREQR